MLADAAGAGTVAGVDIEQVRADLQKAIDALRAQGDVVAAADAMRHLSFATYGRKDSLPLAEEARRLLEPEPEGAELALVYARLAQEHGIQGHNRESFEWCEKALPLLQRFNLDDEALRTRSNSAACRCWLGDLSAVHDLRVLASEAIDPERAYGTHAVTMTLNNLALGELLFGAGPAAAAEALRSAAELARRRGLGRPSLWYKGNLAEALYDLGEWEEVLLITDEIAEWERGQGHTLIGLMASPLAAMILSARGEVDAAQALIEELLPRAREIESAPIHLSALTAAAAVAASSGESDSARGFVKEFEQLTADATDLLRYLAEIGRVCARVGDLASLERLLDRAGDLDPRLDRFLAGGRALLAEVEEDQARAESLYAELSVSWSNMHCIVEQAHALLGVGRCRLALDRLEQAVPPLREAESIFTRLGARLLAGEAAKLQARAAGAR